MLDAPAAFRRVTVLAGILALAGAGAACESRDERQSTQSGAVDTAAVKAAIDSLRAAYENAVATGNFQPLGGMLAEGAVMVRPGGPQWDSLFAASELPFPPGATIDITPIEVRVLNHEWAYELGNSLVTYTPRGAAAGWSLRDTYLIVFRNTGDGWKIFREVASSNLPPPASLR